MDIITSSEAFLMLGVIVWIFFLEVCTRSLLSDFAARKLCHSGCGLLMLNLDPRSLASRIFVWAVASSSILMIWDMSLFPAFRFSRHKDVGITVYLLLVSLWFYLQWPIIVLAPVFFADPGGAIVGKWASRHFPRLNPVILYNKTVIGSSAVFALSWASICYPCSPSFRLIVAALCTVAEACGGEYDNLALALVAVAAWYSAVG